MTTHISRRQLLGGTGGALTASVFVAGADPAAAADVEQDGSWTGVVAAIDGSRARVAGDGAGDDAWRPVASLSPLRVGDEVVVGPVDVGGPFVVSPLFRQASGRTRGLSIANRRDGSRRLVKAYPDG